MSQINDLKIDTCLTRRSAYGKDWLAKCQDNVTDCDMRSWCWWHGLPVGQHYKVTMITHCHKSVSVLIWPGHVLKELLIIFIYLYAYYFVSVLLHYWFKFWFDNVSMPSYAICLLSCFILGQIILNMTFATNWCMNSKVITKITEVWHFLNTFSHCLCLQLVVPVSYYLFPAFVMCVKSVWCL